MEELIREMCDFSHAAHATLWSARGDQVLLELLKRRYELGEITSERFEEVRRWMGVSDASTADQTGQHYVKEETQLWKK
ncbi:MAG: hypothetical protein HZB51_25310 [Chloroflexi bacterium]|nr:hypothetical protein [Chloroflexota bacterium]